MKRCLMLLCLFHLITMNSGCTTYFSKLKYNNSTTESSANMPTVDEVGADIILQDSKRALTTLGFATSFKVAEKNNTDTDLRQTEVKLMTRIKLVKNGIFKPYVGGGLGWYRYWSREKERVITGCVLTTATSGLCTYYNKNNDSTLSSGLFASAAAGIRLGGRGTNYFIEYRQDFSKSDDFFDLNINAVTMGIIFSFR